MHGVERVVDGSAPPSMSDLMRNRRISVQLRQGGQDLSHLRMGDTGVVSSGQGYSVTKPSGGRGRAAQPKPRRSFTGGSGTAG